MTKRLIAYSLADMHIGILYFILDHQKSIYQLMARTNANIYGTMDMQVRTFHYVKPHTEKVLGCQECYKDLHEYLDRVLK